MKITKKQLKKLILKEFLRNDNNELDFNLNDILYPSDGNIDPPEINPRRGGGGRNCEPGSARYERIFDKVMNAYEPWIMSTFSENNHEFGQYGEYANHLLKLGVNPEEYGRHIIKGFISIMEYIVEHLCLNGGNMYKLFNDPRPAL